MRPPRLIHLTLLAGALSAAADRPASAGDHHKRSTRAYVVVAEPTREYYVESAPPAREYVVEAAPARRVVEYRTVAPAAARARDYEPEKYPQPEDFRYNPRSRDFDYAPAATKGSPQAREAEPATKEQPAPAVRERVIEREVPVVRERVIEREVPVVRERVVVREVPVVRERVVEREVPVVRERVVERAAPVRAILVRDHCLGWLRP